MEYIKIETIGPDFHPGVRINYHFHYYIYNIIKNLKINKNLSRKLCYNKCCNEIWLNLWKETYIEISLFQGSDINKWKYGYYQIAYGETFIFNKMPLLSALYSNVIQGIGNIGVINLAGNFKNGRFQLGVALRLIFDLSSMNKSLCVSNL